MQSPNEKKDQLESFETMHKHLMIDQHTPHWKPGLNATALEKWEVPALLVAAVMYLLKTPASSDVQIVMNTSIRK